MGDLFFITQRLSPPKGLLRDANASLGHLEIIPQVPLLTIRPSHLFAPALKVEQLIRVFSSMAKRHICCGRAMGTVAISLR
jgi:hypothetical protein